MKRNFIFYIHSVAGLFSGLFILLMSLSGAALVFQTRAGCTTFSANYKYAK